MNGPRGNIEKNQKIIVQYQKMLYFCTLKCKKYGNNFTLQCTKYSNNFTLQCTKYSNNFTLQCTKYGKKWIL